MKNVSVDVEIAAKNSSGVINQPSSYKEQINPITFWL